MKEKILNIYLLINDGIIEGIRAKSYEISGEDSEKINYLYEMTEKDYASAETYDPPLDKKGKLMSYRKFARLEYTGNQYRLFRGLFENYELPENPIVCLTPVVDGVISVRK